MLRLGKENAMVFGNWGFDMGLLTGGFFFFGWNGLGFFKFIFIKY